MEDEGQGMTDSSGATGQAKRGQRGGGRQPVDSKTRARVRKLAREGQMSRNAIAKECGISTSTVTRICAEATPPITFDRTMTKVAVEARTVDLKARRTALSSSMLDDVDELRRRMFLDYQVKTTDGNGTVVTYEASPGARDWKDTMTAVGIAIDKHLVLVKADSDDRDLPAVDAWLAAMMGGN